MRLVRAVLISLLISLLVGLAIGTWIRLQLEAPVRYIGCLTPADAPGSAAPRSPFDVGHTGARVLDPRQHEEQIRQPIDVAQHTLL